MLHGLHVHKKKTVLSRAGGLVCQPGCSSSVTCASSNWQADGPVVQWRPDDQRTQGTGEERGYVADQSMETLVVDDEHVS